MARDAPNATRLGSYDRTPQTSAGEVNLKVPKLRRQTFETAMIERYRRRESSVEEALIEMYLVGHAGEPEHGVEPQQEYLRQKSRRGGIGGSKASMRICISTAS